jgi:hypothetical protein
MKAFYNTFPLHKLYGFLLLNTSLIVFIPALVTLIGSHDLTGLPIEVIGSLALSLSGVILSTLFILRKKIAVQLITGLLIITIAILSGYMFYTLSQVSGSGMETSILVLSVFGFFIVEGILGLLIIHSQKLSEEFNESKIIGVGDK